MYKPCSMCLLAQYSNNDYDCRFVLKVTDFGLPSFYINDDGQPKNMHAFYRSKHSNYLWLWSTINWRICIIVYVQEERFYYFRKFWFEQTRVQQPQTQSEVHHKVRISLYCTVGTKMRTPWRPTQDLCSLMRLPNFSVPTERYWYYYRSNLRVCFFECMASFLGFDH